MGIGKLKILKAPEFKGSFKITMLIIIKCVLHINIYMSRKFMHGHVNTFYIMQVLCIVFIH